MSHDGHAPTIGLANELWHADADEPEAESDETPAAPDTYQLAAELNVDAAILRRFVDEHPKPTAPIVLGWAHGYGGLSTDPADLRGDVEAWLAAGGHE